MTAAPASRPSWRPVAGLQLAVAAALAAVGTAAYRLLPSGPVDSGPAGHPSFWLWAQWDAGWYHAIATAGYSYRGPGVQSAVAFFPAYPALMRMGGWVVGDALVAGVILTYLCGFVAALGVHRLARRHVPAHAGLAVALFVLAPFSFYFFGVVYADALFVAAAVWTFVLFEEGRWWWGVPVGMIATGARPVGLAVTAGVVVMVARAGDGPAWSTRALRPRLVPLLAAGSTGAGFLAYVAYLWWRFREPFAFALVESAPGWQKTLSWRSLAKVDFLRYFSDGVGIASLALAIGAVLAVLGVVLLPAIFRRLGPGYATYTALVLVVPFLLSRDLIGMGRYALAVFPLPVVLARHLGERRRAAVAVGATSAVLLGLMYSYFARDFYLS